MPQKIKKPTVHTEYTCTTTELALLVKKISERAEILSIEIFKIYLMYCKNNVLNKTTCKKTLS